MVPLGDKNQYVGNGATDEYVYDFRIFDKTHLKVTKLVSGASAETPLTVDVDYTVADVGEDEGTITLLAGNLPNGDKLTIRRFLPLTQDSVFTNQGAYHAESHQNEFDRGVMVAQQQQSELDRCLKIAETDTVSAAAVILPPVSQRAGKYLKFDGSGNLSVATSVDPGLVDFSPFGEDFVDSADAQAARTLLGFNVAGGKVPQALIGDDAVGAAQLADNAVVTANIQDLQITTVKLANDAVDSTKLKDSAGTDADRAVTTNHIRDNAVTGAKVQSDAAVDANRAIGTNHIKDASITPAKLTGAITAGDGTISWAKFKVTTVYDQNHNANQNGQAFEYDTMSRIAGVRPCLYFFDVQHTGVNNAGGLIEIVPLHHCKAGDDTMEGKQFRIVSNGQNRPFNLKIYKLSLT